MILSKLNGLLDELCEWEKVDRRFVHRRPEWEIHLENLDKYEIEETGMSREKLFDLLEYLYEKKVIR